MINSNRVAIVKKAINIITDNYSNNKITHAKVEEESLLRKRSSDFSPTMRALSFL